MSGDRHTLVTGGAGFIGSHLVERLIADGHRVVVIDDLSTGSTKNLQAVSGETRLTFLRSTVTSTSELDQLVKNAEFVYHLAASVGVERVLRNTVESIENNLRSTQSILSVAASHNTPVLIASSSEVYGKGTKEKFSEEDDLAIGPPTIARWSYAASKLAGEFLAMALRREKGLPVIIGRIFNTVGPRQSGQFGMVLPRFVEAAISGRPLRVFGDGTQTRSFCWVADTVEALVRLSRTERAFGEAINIGSDQPLSIRRTAELVLQVSQSASTIEEVPYSEAYGTGFEDMHRRCPDTSKLARLAGFQASTRLTDIIEALCRTHRSTDETPPISGRC